MFEQPRWSIWSAPTLLAGLYWAAQAASVGGVTSFTDVATALSTLSAEPAGMAAAFPTLVAVVLLFAVALPLVTAGGALLFAPGDRRVTQLGAVAGLGGAVLALPLVLAVGFGGMLGLLVTALAGAFGAGRMALQLEPHTPGIPTPEPRASLAAKVAVDEAILGFEHLLGTTGFALDGSIERVVEELEEIHGLFARQGFLDKPEAYHVAPPDLPDPEIRRTAIAGHDVEVLRFESGYAPAEGEPGRARWLGYDPCRDGWAHVLRHEGEPRPWLIATNGYRMGYPKIDIGLFGRFFASLGLNVLIPVLPLHGVRRLGWHSGTGFIGLDVVDTIHAESQAIWDMRRLLSWIRTQDAPAVGAFGLSLGGLTTANFASLAEGLTCAVPGIPLVDIRRMLERHAASNQLRYAESVGFDLDRMSDVMRVISPLALTPRVPAAGRMIFGGNVDRLVTPDQVLDLWRHWEEPDIVWYHGAHVSFANERRVWEGVDRTLRAGGLST